MSYQLVSHAVGTFLALFPLTNPLGAVPIFYSLAASDSARARGRQAKQIALNAVVILMLFFLAGRLILNFFGISLGVLRIAGGLLIARTAWEMVTGPPSNKTSTDPDLTSGWDISLIPMAFPVVSGPGAIGMVITLAAQNSHWSNYLGSLLGIGLLGLTLYLCLALGEPLVKLLGKRGLQALNQVLGFLVLAIAVQFVADGTLGLITKDSAWSK